MPNLQFTLTFLSSLSANKNREWFESNRPAYEKSHKEMILFADLLLAEMNVHDVIETPSGKKSLFRIYNDARFGKDKSPYKDNWAGHFRRASAHRRGGYYYQIGPKEAFVLGGFFGPNPQDLLHLRHQLAQDAEPLRQVITSEEFTSFFGKLLGEQVKTAPRGFEKEHPDLDLLRYKQFLVRHDFSSKEVRSDHFPEIMSDAFQRMRPFLDVMTEYLITDLNGELLI